MKKLVRHQDVFFRAALPFDFDKLCAQVARRDVCGGVAIYLGLGFGFAVISPERPCLIGGDENVYISAAFVVVSCLAVE